jgi:hypothetical protein
MSKFYVDFVLPVSACRVIKADTKEEAEAIAKKMIDDGEYWEGVIDSIENDYDCWRSKYCMVEVIGDASDDMEADNE